MSFKGLEHHLEKNLYNTPKGPIRLNVLWEDMLLSLPQLKHSPMTVLDIGGGAGKMSIKLAELGHRVTLCDASEEMLNIAEANIRKECPEPDIRLIHSEIDSLHMQVREKFDLVLIHGVLEWIDDPERAFTSAASFVKDGGFMSLLFYNMDRLILKCGIHGHFKRIQTGTYIRMGQKKKLTPTNPLRQSDVDGWIKNEKLETVSKAGIRIFYDLFRNEECYRNREAELEIIEKTYSRMEPYASIAQHIHLVCRKISATGDK